MGGSKSLAVIQGVCNPVLFSLFFLLLFSRRACNVPADVTAEALSLALVHFGCRNKSETEEKEACTIENVGFFSARDVVHKVTASSPEEAEGSARPELKLHWHKRRQRSSFQMVRR